MLKKYFICVLFLCSLFIAYQAIAGTIIVDNDGGGDYVTIQEALDVATHGDTVFVKPGVYYEQVTLKEGVNLIGSGTGGISSGFRIAYIYKDDTLTAHDYQTFLDINHYTVTRIPMADITTTDFSSFDCIIVGPDTGYLSQWKLSRLYQAVIAQSIFSQTLAPQITTRYDFAWFGDTLSINKLKNSGKPIIGLGEGGYSYFGKLGLDIGYGQGWHGEQSSVYALNNTHQIWRTPNRISIPTNNIVQLYTTSQETVAIYSPSEKPGVLPLGRQSDNATHFPLIAQDGRYLLWGYGGSPDDMTLSGQSLFINIITSMASPFCIIDGERGGATVSATNVSSGQISGFTILNSEIQETEYLIPYYPFFLDDLVAKEILPAPITRSSQTARAKESAYLRGDTLTIDAPFLGTELTLIGSDYGVKINNSTIVVSNNRISDNSTGIYAYNNSHAILRNNRIDTNRLYGIQTSGSECTILNNLIIKNKTGMYASSYDDSHLINNTIANNQEHGIYAHNSSLMVKNNIVSANSSIGIYAVSNASLDITFNDVWNNGEDYFSASGGLASPSVGNISEDPLFVDIAHEDYHLRYTIDEISPCIDAGDPNPLYNDHDDTINDMGYTGGHGGEITSFGSVQTGYLFTAIGDIPESEIEQDSASPSQGLADVDPNVAKWFSIPAYKDAPFGGNLRIRGLFGVEEDVTYYQLKVKRLDGSPSALPEPLTDPLYKTHYTINPDNTITREIIKIGPRTVSTTSTTIGNLYKVTRFDFWYQPDLLMIWRTAGWDDGTYEITMKAYTETLIPLTMPERKLIIVINNQPLNVKIHHVKYDIASPHYGTDPNMPECGIIKLTHEQENLHFIITATHGGEYLRGYRLLYHYGTNKSGTIKQEFYDTGISTAPYWYGVVEEEINSATDAPGLQWKTCAYQFQLQAWDRRTNGEYYLGYKAFRDHYYIEVCEDCGAPVITNPTIYLSTISDVYSFGDMTTLTIRLLNPLPTDTFIYWILWFSMPEYEYLWNIHDGYYLLPAYYDDTFTINLPMSMAPAGNTPVSYGSCLLDPYTFGIYSYTSAEFLLIP
ncbi:MAG: right-handed parallel beta-helix repeat-containing protein [bacterium]